MKKIIIILSAILLVNMQVAIVYASNENLTGREEIYQEYKDDPQFIAMLEEYGQDYADKFIDNVMQVRAEEMLRGGGGNICYQYVTNIKQTQNYNCGSTITNIKLLIVK